MPNQEFINCPKCNIQLRKEARFCNNCGYAVSQPPKPTEPLPRSTSDAYIGRVFDGRYEILSYIGGGGMGKVYRAKRLLIGDEVAIKILTANVFNELSPDESAREQSLLTERFRREARAAAKLNSCPNVVSIYDVGAAHDVVPDYIVMELVTGETLRDLLRREGKLTTELAARLMKEICVGVGAAHTAGIIHRDLKPENVIVQPNGQVKILDFGLAKLREMASEKTENQLTKAGTILGTYRYMSPEQWGEREPDSRSDVYSLGAMLYEMLSGNSPFEANSMEGYVAKHLMETPNPFGRNLAIPTNIERIVFRCLEKKPDDRPNDANALLNELNQLSFASDPEATVIRQAPPKNLPLMQTIKAEITNQTNLANQTISYVSQGIDTIKTHAPQVWKVFLATMTSSLAAPTLSLCVTTLMTLIFSDGTELQVAVYFTLFYFVLTPIFTLLSLMLAPKLLSLPTLKFGKLFLTGFKIGIALTLFSFFVSILSVLITNSFSLDSDKIRRHPLSIVLPFLISVVILSPWIFFELRNAFSVMQTEISLNSPGKN